MIFLMKTTWSYLKKYNINFRKKIVEDLMTLTA